MYRALSAPITCQVELTSACNNKCLHCYNHWRHGNETINTHMTRETIDYTILEMEKNGIFQVTLTGGEVFLRRKELFYMIEKLKAAKISCTINSNLTVFTEQDAQRLHSLGVTGILTSLCSFDSRRHDEITRHRGSFKKTMRGIAIALKAGITIAVSMVVTKSNVNDVRETGLFLKRSGVNQFFATKASPPLNAKNFEEFMISKEQLLIVMNDLSELRDSHGLTVGILECYPLCSYKDQSFYSFAAGRRCSAGITTCTISANGTIRPCSHSDEIFGTITAEGLQSTWEKMGACRDGSRLPAGCHSCKLLSRCSGGCRVDALYCTGKYAEMDPYATPDEVSSVKLAPPNFPQLGENDQFTINEGLKIRQEKFGVLVADVNHAGTPALITMDTLRLIRRLEGNIFNLTTVTDITKLPKFAALNLCSAMVKDSIFIKIN